MLRALPRLEREAFYAPAYGNVTRIWSGRLTFPPLERHLSRPTHREGEPGRLAAVFADKARYLRSVGFDLGRMSA
jgi:hypothetical protein